jgi:hypothetical protein
MKKRLFTAIISCFVLLAATGLLAQKSGDFKSAGSGQWNAKATWQTYNGSAWVAASAVPAGSESITLQASDSVDVNVPVTITGSLINLGGKLGNSAANLTFGDKGVYEHAANGGTMPVATWGTGSTCLFSGIVSQCPSNSNQNFYNFTWNCPNYGTSAVNFAWGGNTIGGTVRIVGCPNRTYTRLTSSNVGNAGAGPNVITIKGDIILEDYLAAFTSTGSSGADTIEVYVKGSIISNGLFNLGNGSGAMVKWVVSGDVMVKGGSMTTHSNVTSAADSMVFAGTAKQTFFKADSISSISNVQFGVRPGSIVDLTTTAIGGTVTTFTQGAGSTLLTSHVNGLRGNLSMQGKITLPADGSYEYNGTEAQADSLLPATVKNLTISNPTTVSLVKPVTVTGVLKLAAGTLDNSVNAVTIAAGGSVVFAGGKTTASIPGWSGVEENTPLPNVFKLFANYPNPFNPSTTIEFTVAKEGFATLKVFNILGQEVARLFEGVAKAGNKLSVNFNASRLSSGVYIAQLDQNGMKAYQRMILMK